MDLTWLWIPATLAAAALQTARNITQRRLTEIIGTMGATQVRFLYGLPFALLFLLVVSLAHGAAPPMPDRDFVLFATFGAVSQIVATGLMLAAMRRRGFAVVTALMKTEPVQVALFAALVLGERVGMVAGVGIGIATLGVVTLGHGHGKPGTAGEAPAGASPLMPVLMGLAAGAFFALAAVGFRGAILALPSGTFLMRATTTLAASLFIQTVLLALWLAFMDRAAFLGSLKVWRASLTAGFLGAAASQGWFIGFSLTSAANVRTLALVEVLMATLLSGKLFGEGLSRREAVALSLVVLGVGLLLLTHA